MTTVQNRCVSLRNIIEKESILGCWKVVEPGGPGRGTRREPCGADIVIHIYMYIVIYIYICICQCHVHNIKNVDCGQMDGGRGGRGLPGAGWRLALMANGGRAAYPSLPDCLRKSRRQRTPTAKLSRITSVAYKRPGQSFPLSLCRGDRLTRTEKQNTDENVRAWLSVL